MPKRARSEVALPLRRAHAEFRALMTAWNLCVNLPAIEWMEEWEAKEAAALLRMMPDLADAPHCLKQACEVTLLSVYEVGRPAFMRLRGEFYLDVARAFEGLKLEPVLVRQWKTA